MPQLISAEGFTLTNAKFPEKSFGPSVFLTLTEDQKQILDLAENKDAISTEVSLTKKQQHQIFQEAQLKISFANIFDGKKGYRDCTCFGAPSNLASRFNSSQIQMPYSFIEDSLMQKASTEEFQEQLLFSPEQSKSKTVTESTYQLDGFVANLPVVFELTVPKNTQSLVKGHYTYLSGKFKDQKFKLLGKQHGKNQFHLREYKIAKENLRYTADIKLTRRNKILTSRDPWTGQMTNIDGSQFNIKLATTKKLKAKAFLQAKNN